MLPTGQRVVYRNRVCEVVAVRENYAGNQDYYELKALFENSLKLYIPVVNATPPELRPIMSRQEALDLIGSIKGMEKVRDSDIAGKGAASSQSGQGLKEEYSQELGSFAPECLLRVMRHAYERSLLRTERGLKATAADRQYFQMAEKLLCDEMSLTFGIDRDDMPDFLRSLIEQALR